MELTLPAVYTSVSPLIEVYQNTAPSLLNSIQIPQGLHDTD
jgi:hypothetical protein